VANAVADSPNLMGAYAFTRNTTCIVVSHTVGFNPNFQALGPTIREFFAEEGVRTFNGDGTGTQSSKNLNIYENEIAGSVGAASSHFTDNFKYIINGDGTWTIQGGGTISGTVDTGPRASQTFTITNIAPAVGHISQNGMTLTLATVTRK
jgi:hypothetical protein